MRSLSRRQFFSAVGVGVGLSLGGCLGKPQSPESPPGRASTINEGSTSKHGLPLAVKQLSIQYPFKKLRSEIVSGGPPKDGIPSVDEPTFVGATEANQTLRADDIVFGVVRGADVKAYPQKILVWHEIANDTLDRTPVSVTYCPLTGTAMGFERGETTFGVSGRLLNDNLVMYDRATDSRWPQMLGTAISGELEGKSLREFRLIWTTWGSWRDAYPNTQVLSEDTGYIREYDRDPYGSYTPLSGYYEGGSPLFPPLRTDDRYGSKSVVIGTRTSTGAAALSKASLRDRGVIEGELAGTPLVAIHNPSLDTAYVYRNPDDAQFTLRDGTVTDSRGQRYTPDDLPLEREYAFDAMWFAWAGFYPETREFE